MLFFLGGAPGVAAAWQEFGGFGPKRMKWAADGTAGLPPYGWVDNPDTLLGQADLVFVNPVGTAYSRPDQPARGPDFWNTAGDIASLGEFVRSFLNTYDRRNSPLFLAGEDFGTARAAGLANYLIERQIPVHGVVLLSMTLSADSIAGDEQYITLLPSLVMAAWYHKKLAPELQALSAEQIAEQARQFAAREYLHALYKGDRMTPEERTKVVANLSRLTGLSKAFIVNNNLRITLDRFNTELLRDQRRALSNSDARVTGFVPASGGGGRGGGGGGGGGRGRNRLQPEQSCRRLPDGLRDLPAARAHLHRRQRHFLPVERRRRDVHLDRERRREPRRRVRPQSRPAPVRGRELFRSQCAVLRDRVYPGAPERVAGGPRPQYHREPFRGRPDGLPRQQGSGQAAKRPGQVHPTSDVNGDADRRTKPRSNAMRINGRFKPMLCSFVILIAAMGVGAFAQGRGAGSAPNNFYRFNYSLDEMQPIDYPAKPITTKHQITLQKETIQYTAHVGFMPIRNATSGVSRGASVLRLLCQGRRHRQVQTAALVPVQRRAGRGHHLAAHGRLRPQGGEAELRTAWRCRRRTPTSTILTACSIPATWSSSTPWAPDSAGRTEPGYGPNFGGVDNDLAAFGEFIRCFLNEYDRWSSPLFVGGESYGTTRAAGLAGYLTDRGMPLNGVMLLSAVIDTNAGAGIQRQLSTLPTEIMTAHYHKKLPPELQKLTVEQIAEQARQFASGEYLEYLFDGARATPAQRDKVLTNMARLTGLSKAFVDANDLIVPLGPFSTELLRDRHLMTSRLDSRFAGYQIDAGSTSYQFRFQQRQHHELLPGLLRGVHPQ